MKLPKHKTKIVCTIGPASEKEEVLEQLIETGLNVARLNFAHGKKEDHSRRIKLIRKISQKVGKVVAIMADLPGHKIRIGKLAHEPMMLENGQLVVLSTDPDMKGDNVIPCEFKGLPSSVKSGSAIYLNDGFLKLVVKKVEGANVYCEVASGGRLFSFKGLNLPGAKISVDPVTEHDLELVEFGLEEGIDAFSVSFVESAADIIKVKEFIRGKNRPSFVIAKIEREEAINNIDEVLEAADGLMVARGDLGVEIALERVPVVQKQLIHKANLMGKPVITATQMLASMVESSRPTRAEVTDVANAILDGTDAVMLSEETAIGKYPVEAVATMTRIAQEIESRRGSLRPAWAMSDYWKKAAEGKRVKIKDSISLDVAETLELMDIKFIATPTTTGLTARSVSRFKPDCWIISFSSSEKTEHALAFSAGVWPVRMGMPKDGWDRGIIAFLRENLLVTTGDLILITEGVAVGQPTGTNSLKIIKLD